MVTAYRLLEGLKSKLDPRFQLTADGFVPFIGAGERAWGAAAPDFAQLVKLYGATTPGFACCSPPKITEAVPTMIWGNPDPEHISTS